MELPCPIQAVVGFDGVNVGVMAKSHASTEAEAPFVAIWMAGNEERRIQTQNAFARWLRSNFCVFPGTISPIRSALIVTDPSLFLRTTGWQSIHTWDNMVMLDSRSMMLVLGGMMDIGQCDRYLWGEAIATSTELAELGEVLEARIRSTKHLMSICASVRSMIGAGLEIKRIMGQEPVNGLGG
ncbi:hypothetical protein EPO17_01400 [Patescibacteria group bacterium]|nr:MAG: hypothetical protein EPO17_01400 [Patescibacteria group bacterium]